MPERRTPIASKGKQTFGTYSTCILRKIVYRSDTRCNCVSRIPYAISLHVPERVSFGSPYDSVRFGRFGADGTDIDRHRPTLLAQDPAAVH